MCAVWVTTGETLQLQYLVAGRTTRMSSLSRLLRFAQLIIWVPSGDFAAGAFVFTPAQLVTAR